MRMRHNITAAISAVSVLVLVAVACAAPPTTPTPANLTPIAVIAAEPQAGVAPLVVEFSGLSSTDADGTIAGYVWSFGDGGTSTDPEPTHTYVDPGSYNARLIVTDDEGASSPPVIVPIEVTFDFDPIVLVDDDGADAESCGTPAAPCASISYGLSRAQADAKTQVWVAAGEYSAFAVVDGIDVRGGFAEDFTGPGDASVVRGAFDAGTGISAAITAIDIDDATVEGLTALGADESENGRTALAAYVGGTGAGLALDNVTLTGGQHGAEATALLVNGAASVSLSSPTVAAGDAVGAGNSSYGIRAINGANVTVDGGTIAGGYGANGAAGGAAGASPATAGNGGNGGNGSFGSRGSGGTGAAGTNPRNGGNGGRGGSYSGSGDAGSAGGGGATGGAGGCGSLFGDCSSHARGGNGGGGGAAGSGGAGASAGFTAGATFVGSSGGAGGAGGVGAGGAGGGGGKTASTWGGGGGGGGAGGAGGAGATIGGGPGGGSFGVYAHDATIELNGTIVTAGVGGRGGIGQRGATGGTGGAGGTGGNKSCCEGGGGAGGGGGGGGGGGAGGGAGGPSIAALHSGSGTLTVNTSSLGAPTAGSSGGTGGPGGVEGAPGTGGLPGDAGLLAPIFGGSDAPTVGFGGESGAAGSTGQIGSPGAIFGSWDNGVTTETQHVGTPETTTTTTPPPAEPLYTPVAMSCLTSAMGQSSYDTNNTGATVLAPRSVAAGGDFVVEVTPDPVNVPTSGGGYSIGSLTNLRVSLAVPAGATFVSGTASGGSNLGSGTPTVTQSGGKVTLTVPGPLAPGSTAVLPKLDLTFMATGGPGTLIESKFAGTSYSNPGLVFTVAVTGTPIGTITATSNCYAAANPVLATTEVR